MIGYGDLGADTETRKSGKKEKLTSSRPAVVNERIFCYILSVRVLLYEKGSQRKIQAP